jgi:hypothetical protein
VHSLARIAALPDRTPRRVAYVVPLWTTTDAEIIALVIAALVIEVLLLVWLPSAFPKDPRPDNFRPDPLQEWHDKLIEWERNRVLSAAKGIGSSAIGFLTALVLALAKGEIAVQVSGFSLLGCALGALGALVLAAAMNAATRKFLWDLLRPL